MHAGDATVVFPTPTWSATLYVLAWLAVGWELASLLVRIWRTNRPTAAAGVTAGALLAGPVFAAVAGVFGAMVSHPGQPPAGRNAVRAGLRATFVMAMVGLMLLLPPGQNEHWPAASVPVLAACGIAWCLRAYARTTAPVKRRWKALLLALRIAVVLLLAGYALEPVLTSRFVDEVRGTVLLGLDASKSMAQKDEKLSVGPTEAPVYGTRMAAVARELIAARSQLRDLADRVEVKVFPFAGSAGALTDLPADAALQPPPAVGEATSLGDSTQEALNAASRSGGELSAIVLISDGCNNSSEMIAPDNLARLLGSRGLPVYTVGVGSATVLPDTRTLSVRDLQCQEQVEAFHRLPATATVEALGLSGREVRVTCRFGEEIVDTQTLRIGSDQSRQAVRFVHVPLHAGFHRLTVSAELVGARPRNFSGQREASRLVQVVDRELRVLYVEGRVRFEVKFVAQALASSGRFSLDRRVVLRDGEAAEPGGLGLKLEDWLYYHAIIFGDLPASRFSPEQLALVREVVADYGKGFCMIGGQETFGNDRWAGTPIADMLPVDVLQSVGQIDTPVRVVPTTAGRDSDVMRIGEANEPVAEAWGRLEDLPGANRLGGVKPAARVLAETPDRQPLIVIQPYGKGRTMAVAMDTTYRWVLTKADTADLQKRFWRQVALYLCAPQGNVWVTTDKPQYDLRRLVRAAQTVEVTAGVEDPQGRPTPQALTSLKLTLPGGKQLPLVPDVQAGRLHAKLLGSLIDQPGVYTLDIEAKVADKTLTARHQFEVTQQDTESQEVLANFDLLARLAKQSGGVFVPLSQLGDLLETVRTEARPREVERIETHPLADDYRWPVILAVIVLLCLEWAIRKRKGLV